MIAPWSWRLAIIQTAKTSGLASLLAVVITARGLAQATGRVEVSATVVNAAPTRSALASARWLLARRDPARRENGLATVAVNRERRRVSISYLKN